MALPKAQVGLRPHDLDALRATLRIQLVPEDVARFMHLTLGEAG